MARSNLFNIALVSVLLWICGVSAHGRLTVPSPRGKYQGVPDYKENEPVQGGLASSAFVCRDHPSVSPSQYLPVTAGSDIDFAWSFTALHPGDCFAYISYDGDDSIAPQQKKFFKIAQWAECRNMSDVDIKLRIPSYLPSSDHAILRFEWYALHVRPTIEYYAQCVDLKITGNPNGGLPSPLVYPGVTTLPVDGREYRDAYDPSDNRFFIGPPIATYGGNVETAAPATTQPATTRPATTVPATTRPVTTQPATTRPATTQPATTQPATTQPATTRPATTKPATTAPVAGTCTVGKQRCSAAAQFATCIFTNAYGATSYGAFINCPPGTRCENTSDGYINCL